MTLAWGFAFLLATEIISLSQAQTNSTAEDYRLPQIFTPYFYDVELNLTAEALTENFNEFGGNVRIQFSVTNETNQIALHASHNFILINRISFNNTDITQENYSINDVTDILKINLSTILIPEGQYDLTIEYVGNLSTSDMYGFYKSSYDDGNGTTKYLATTQFESTYARRAFPCFDEPSLKASFAFTIIYPQGLNVLFNTLPTFSNTTNGVTTLQFASTPTMSTYLLAFIISEFTCTSGVPIGIVPYQVCSRNITQNLREFAVEIGPQILTRLNNFTNFDYDISVGKLDQVAIPDFAAGAMENWGLVTYRETALLWDRNESSNRYQQRVATVVAHELAHQWFGNLVTCNWWSEIFLNEGFATYFEFYISNEIFPSWELDKQFVVEELHEALLSDALANSHALQSACSTPAEISSKFSTISYSKGGSILRMVQHFMQLENFRTGIQNYLVNYQYNNTVPEDLWLTLNGTIVNSVSKLPADLTTVMETWTIEPGFPVLTVSLNGDNVIISQARFLLSGVNSNVKWYVPISYTLSGDVNKFQTTTPNDWLLPNQNLSITLPQTWEWIILNNQQTGFYRVNYDVALWDRIKAGLQKIGFDGITDLNRAQIVDDLFNLARSNQITYSKVFDVTSFLANDTSYYSWFRALAGYNFLLRRVGQNSPLGTAISNDVLQLISNLYASVPFSALNETDQIYTHKQVLALTWACKLGNTNCVEEVQGLFNQYKSSGQRPNKNLRSIIYCNGLRYSNLSSDWEFLWDAYLRSADLATEQITILSSLGCTKNTTLLREYISKSITPNSGIRPQDALSVFSSVYVENYEGVDVAFEFLTENHVAIANAYQSWNSLGNLIKGIAERFTTSDQINRLRTFINTGNLSENFKVAANEALETAEQNLSWLQQFEDDLKTYYNLNGGGKVTSSLLAIIFAIIFIFVTK